MRVNEDPEDRALRRRVVVLEGVAREALDALADPNRISVRERADLVDRLRARAAGLPPWSAP